MFEVNNSECQLKNLPIFTKLIKDSSPLFDVHWNRRAINAAGFLGNEEFQNEEFYLTGGIIEEN